jgi:RimJ/RimL family protein N-acetyltransferase
MLDYVYGHDQIVAEFTASLIPHCRRGFGPNIVAMGVIEDDRLIAGFVYHNYDPEAAIMEISGAALPGKYWLTRETLARIYQYPFLRCDCQMIVQRVPADNERLLYQLSRLNYAFVTIERLFGRDRDGVVGTLTRERWEQSKFTKRLNYREPSLEEAA